MIVVYNTERQRFEAQTSYAERNTANPLLKAAGFAFDFNGSKVWHTAGYKAPKSYLEQVAIAAKVLVYLDADAKTRIANDSAANLAAIQSVAVEIEKTESLDSSRATDSDIDIPAPQGLSYLPYQRAGIAYALKRTNTLIGDEMGLGKTIQFIGIVNATPDAKSVLIVCPASLKLNWAREFKKWDVKGLSIGIAKGTKLPSTDVVIVNYDILDRNADALRARDWDILGVDECHKAKNPAAKRTQFLLGKYEWVPSHRIWSTLIEPIEAKRRVFLTGTPVVNRPVELWPIIRALDPHGLGRYKSKFEKRYCGAFFNGFGYDKSGATNLPELQDRMRATFMVRRLKADVLKDLPAKRRQIVVLEVDQDAKGVAEIVRREREAYDSLKSTSLKKADIDFTGLSAARAEVAKLKIPYVIEHIREELESVDKLVVMAHHHVVIEALQAAFPAESVVVYGETSLDDRQTAVDRFQTDPNVKLFIGSIQAAGVGLTLTAASNMVFAEIDWVPGNNSQAEDRIHRIGQLESVLIKYLVLDDSVDARIVGQLVGKEVVIDASLDKQTQTAGLPEVGKAEPKPATKIVNGVEVEIKFTLEQMKAILTGLRIIADRCDGALEEDGAGFNKLDTVFGKRLANLFSLTPKQALAGQKLVQKYQGQLSREIVVAAGIIPKGEQDENI